MVDKPWRLPGEWACEDGGDGDIIISTIFKTTDFVGFPTTTCVIV